jgi:hypothetical protein
LGDRSQRITLIKSYDHTTKKNCRLTFPKAEKSCCANEQRERRDENAYVYLIEKSPIRLSLKMNNT